MVWTRKISMGLILATVVVLGVWAIIVASNDTLDDEISVVLLEWASVWKTVPLALGVFMGHWLWPVKKVILGPWRYALLLAVVLLSVLSDIFISYFTIFPLYPFMIGVLAGHWLWPQRERAQP